MREAAEAVGKKKVVTGGGATTVETISTETLPKIEGAVCAQYRQYKGRRLGPYHFLMWREGGRLRKRYIRPADLEATLAACAAHRAEHEERRRSREEMQRWIREFNRASRVVERWIALARTGA